MPEIYGPQTAIGQLFHAMKYRAPDVLDRFTAQFLTDEEFAKVPVSALTQEFPPWSL